MLAIVLASLLWGTTGTAASFLPAAVSPLAIGAATMGLGGALLFAVSAPRALAVLMDPPARRWALLGASGVVAYPLAFYAAMEWAGVAVGNVVSLGSAPVFAALLEFGIERRRPSVRWAVATALAVLGVAALATTGSAAVLSSGAHAGGVGLGLLAGVSYALYTYASGRVIRRGHDSTAAMGALFGAGAVPLLVLLVAVGAPLLSGPSSTALAAYLAIGPMFAAYLLFGAGLRTVRASTATTVTLLEPLVATALAIWVVGERLPSVAWAGIVGILLGVAVLAARRTPESFT